ncbi:MAG: alpha/beta hydrolase [Armatimonadota bacterium]
MPSISQHGIKINYIDRGNGFPLVFLPGLLGSSSIFEYQISGLSDHYRVVSYDFHPAILKRGRKLSFFVDSLIHILNLLKINSCVLTGHSFGALIAMEAAILNPELVLAAILVSPSADDKNVSKNELIQSELLPGMKVQSWIEKIFKKNIIQNENILPSSLVNLKDKIIQPDKSAIVRAASLMLSTQVSNMIISHSIPLLITAGANEKPWVLSTAQKIHEISSNSRLEIIESADHFFPYTKHDELNTLINDFLSHLKLSP